MTSRISPNFANYNLLEPRLGRVRETTTFHTPIKGYDIQHNRCHLRPSGMLLVLTGFEWDFGSGPATDTPEVVIASMAHDAICNMVNDEQLPPEARVVADKFYEDVLKEQGVGWIRRKIHYLILKLFTWIKQR